MSKVQRPKSDFANWLALIAASTIGIIVFSHGASFDIILTFPLTAALVSFFIYDQGTNKSSAAPTLSIFSFYFFIGVSLLAKGLIGIVFPFTIVAFFYLLSRRKPDKIFIVSLFWGTFVAFAVASLWYVPMYLWHGWEFIDEFFIQHHFQRFTSNKYFHPQPFYFFFWVLPLMTIPWLPFFIAAIWSFVKKIFERRDAEMPKRENTVDTSPLVLFSIIWLTVPLLFFSFSGSKLPGYILPAVPAAIILAAECIVRFIRKNEKREKLIQIVATLMFIGVIAGLIFFLPKFAEIDSVKSLIEAANERGMTNEKVLTLHTVSHNAEFYAAGRLVRSEDGKQKKLPGPAEVLDEIRRDNGEPVLVLVPLEYLKQLTDFEYLTSEVLNNNGELAIVLVSAK